MTQRHWQSAAVLGLGLIAGGLGCRHSGPPLAPVTGVVTVNGNPVPGVIVEFQPETPGSPSIGHTDSGGRYELRFSRKRWGALLGKHTVRLDFDHDPDSGDPRPPFQFPANYNSQSELTAEVKSGANEHNFALTIELSKPVSPARRR